MRGQRYRQPGARFLSRTLDTGHSLPGTPAIPGSAALQRGTLTHSGPLYDDFSIQLGQDVMEWI